MIFWLMAIVMIAKPHSSSAVHHHGKEGGQETLWLSEGLTQTLAKYQP